MSLEMTLGMAMVVTMLGTLLAKYVTSNRTVRLRERLADAESELRAARGQLKVIENERAISGRNVNQLERKKERLEKQVQKFKKEIEESN
jgi:chromosome segregation ATPase